MIAPSSPLSLSPAARTSRRSGACRAPLSGWADESPLWSPILFVRERGGYGRAMVLRGGMLFGPVAKLGYSLGYIGHHSWWLGAAWHE